MSEPAAEPDILPPHPHRGLLSAAVMMATVMIILDKTIVNVALPHMMGTFGATSDQITWVLTSYIVAEAIVIPMSGYMANRFGRRRLMLASVVGFVITSFMCSQATGLEEMVFFRFLQGVAGAAVIPLSQSIMVDAFDENARPRAMAIWGMGVMIAPVAGPTIGGYLTDSFQWQSVFFINIPFGILTVVLLAALMRETKRRVTRTDIFGALLLAAGIGAGQIVLDKGNENDWFQSHTILILALLSAVAFAGFVWRALRRRDAILDIRLLKDRNLAMACGMLMVFGLGMFGTISSLPLFLENLMGYPSSEAGLVMAPQGIASFFAMALFARIGGRVPARWIVLTGLSLAFIGSLQLSMLNLQIAPINVAVCLMFLGFGVGLFFVSMSTLAYQTLDASRTSEGAAIYNFARTIGQSIGISIAGTIQSRHAQSAWHELGGNINPYNPNLTDWLAAKGTSLADPAGIAQLGQLLQKQSNLLAFNYTFGVIALSFLLLMPLALFLRSRGSGSSKPPPPH